jgi:hypothetical protein
MSSMSKLVDEDIVGGCKRESKVEPRGVRPLKKALYSYTTLSPMN